MTIRVVLADDHPQTRQGIRTALEQTPDIAVVGEAGDGVEAQGLVAALRPDILLLDLVMPGPSPADVERWVRGKCPDTVTLILTGHDRDALLAEMEEAGAAGFLTKDEDTPSLVKAIRRAARGEVLYTPEQQARVRRWREEVGQRWESLTAREQEVAQQIAAGQSNREIAEMLSISEHTVETHVGNVLRKLARTTRTEVAVLLWKHGLVEEEPASGGNPPEKDG
jgi:DNA-binding NarL/FixJ family response regulator